MAINQRTLPDVCDELQESLKMKTREIFHRHGVDIDELRISDLNKIDQLVYSMSRKVGPAMLEASQKKVPRPVGM